VGVHPVQLKKIRVVVPFGESVGRGNIDEFGFGQRRHSLS
jgi:hypothetical protein